MVYLDAVLTTEEAAAELAPYLGGRNATHFLSDNRRGRSSLPTIPFDRKSNGRIFYSRLKLIAFAEKYLRPARSPSHRSSPLRTETEDCPSVSWRPAPYPILEVSVLSLGAARDLKAALETAVAEMEAAVRIM